MISTAYTFGFLIHAVLWTVGLGSLLRSVLYFKNGPTFFLGFAGLFILSPLLFISNIPIGTVYFLISVLVALGYLQTVRKGQILVAGKEIGALLLLSALMSIAPLARGLQFSFFQGNAWDMLSYLSAAIVFQDYTFTEIKSFTLSEILQLPVVEIAVENTSERPGVHYLFSLFNLPFRDYALELSYTYLCYLCAVFSHTLVRAAEDLGKIRFSTRACILLALSICGSIHLQLVLDINAWSHLCALTFIAGAYWFHTSDRNIQIYDLRFFLSMCGLFIIYPEGWILFGPFFIFLEIWNNFVRKHPHRNLTPIWFTAGSILAGTLLSAIQFPLMWSFVFKQGKIAAFKNPDWYLYYFKFIFDFSEPIRSWLTLPSVLVGLKIPPPTNELWASVVSWINLFLGAFVNLVLAVILWTSVKDRNYKRVLGSGEFIFALIVILILLGLQKYWILGKFVLMFFPILYLIVLSRFSSAKYKSFVWTLAIFSLFLFAYRQIAILKSPEGVHYSSPWPAIERPYTKKNVDLTALLKFRGFENCALVKFQSDTPWFKSFAEIGALVARRNLLVPGEIHSYFHTQKLLGSNPDQDIPQNCIMNFNKGP